MLRWATLAKGQRAGGRMRRPTGTSTGPSRMPSVRQQAAVLESVAALELERPSPQSPVGVLVWATVLVRSAVLDQAAVPGQSAVLRQVAVLEQAAALGILWTFVELGGTLQALEQAAVLERAAVLEVERPIPHSLEGLLMRTTALVRASRRWRGQWRGFAQLTTPTLEFAALVLARAAVQEQATVLVQAAALVHLRWTPIGTSTRLRWRRSGTQSGSRRTSKPAPKKTPRMRSG